ncbi:protein NRT1/ PTR FAMILY 3.1-like [Corylus avellana]|uniref:protein NRT1/ PTR FAMILY 3.1-like n=1 Tax=Corylus avellana TaxID=13451 RepID=UPI00286D3954|nr:protein NRT1/ PTR FAMILY 3.1-like [Corylus avellana]
MELERGNNNNMAKDEKQENMEDFQRKKKKLGGFRTMPFILGNEICDRFATTGFHANMITYLTQELNMPLVAASNTLTNFGGTASFTPLIGALIADSFAGRFWTIMAGSIIYELGLVSITISAVLPKLHPPPCATQENCKELSFSNAALGPLHLSPPYIYWLRWHQALCSYLCCRPI